MSCTVYLKKYSVITTICVIMIFIAKGLNVNFKGLSLHSSNSVQAFPEKSILKTCSRNDVTDMEQSRKFLIVYNLTSENKGNYSCIKMRVAPPTKVCLHKLSRDYVSEYISKHHVWERMILSMFKDELMKDARLGVLDIGANIGVYTLYAATMGRKVVAVEPFMENVLRLHKAAILGGVSKNIVLLQNAVADKRNESMLKLTSDNQGMTRVITKKDCNQKTCPPTTKTILLSDLRYITSMDRAIMKIDIQGFEPRAFTTIECLIDHIYIPVIFMEWEFFDSFYKAQLDRESVQNMIQVLTKRGYLPYTLVNSKLLHTKQHESWPFDMVWRRNTTN